MRGTGADTAPLSCIHISECCFHDSSKFVVCVYRQARASWAAELRSLLKATASDASPSVLQFDDRSDRWLSEHQDEPPRIRRLFAKVSGTEEKHATTIVSASLRTSLTRRWTNSNRFETAVA